MRFQTKTLELNQILMKISSFCHTESAKELVLSLKPMTKIDSIKQSQMEIDEMLTIIKRYNKLPLLDDFDFFKLLEMVKINSLLTVDEIRYIRLFLEMEKNIFNFIKETKNLKFNTATLDLSFNLINEHYDLLILISEIIDYDGLIKDTASEKLFSIRKSISKLTKELESKMQKLISLYQNHLSESFIVTRNDRLCLAVKESSKYKIKGIIHDQSASGQTIYIEPDEARQITQEIENNLNLEKEEINRLLILISNSCYKQYQTLYDNLKMFIKLDTINAKAIYADLINANIVNINTDRITNLIKARHPLLDPKTVVPIDIRLDSNNRVILITGPNTGGKTLALKTTGLLTLMMQVGLLVPASKESNLAIYKEIFADIGDEQSIMQSLSTFSSHLTNIVKMLENITDDSLVLLDEIGSGTDPNEGVSLAIAILESFMQKDLRMVVSTHYSELKSYAYENKNIQCASVAFDKESLKPLYYLQMNTTGSSHAFLIAKRLGLGESVLAKARELYQGRQTDLAKIMEELTDLKAELTKEQEELAILKTDTEKTKLEFYLKTQKLEQEKENIINDIKNKELLKYEKIKREALTIIDDLKNKKTLTTPEIADIKGKLNIKETNNETDNNTLTIGKRVFIIPYQQVGIIDEIKDDQYKVKFGSFNLWFKGFELREEKIKETHTKTTLKIPSKTKKDEDFKPREGKIEVDLRGFRFEDVRLELDKAIDQALLNGIHSLRIIHGFGTGAVRKAVYEYIKNSPYIKDKRFGGEGEGLNGVTIITLK